jgi:hypothetical protein
MFMPLEVVRTWLQITNIGIQRLNDITIEEISKEGIKIGKDMISHITEPQFEKFDYRKYTTPRFAWHSLWEGIHGKGSLAKNPWVWVLDFKKIEKP